MKAIHIIQKEGPFPGIQTRGQVKKIKKGKKGQSEKGFPRLVGVFCIRCKNRWCEGTRGGRAISRIVQRRAPLERGAKWWLNAAGAFRLRRASMGVLLIFILFRLTFGRRSTRRRTGR